MWWAREAIVMRAHGSVLVQGSAVVCVCGERSVLRMPWPSHGRVTAVPVCGRPMSGPAAATRLLLESARSLQETRLEGWTGRWVGDGARMA